MNKLKSFLSLSVLLLLVNCGTTSVPDTEACTVAGVIQAGMSCSHTLTPQTREADQAALFEFLEPQPERPDPANPGEILPARGGAVCQSAEDWNKLKTAAETACNLLKWRCTYEIKEAIRAMSKIEDLTKRWAR